MIRVRYCLARSYVAVAAVSVAQEEQETFCAACNKNFRCSWHDREPNPTLTPTLTTGPNPNLNSNI